MAFALQAVVGSTTYNLSDGAPYKLESATGLGLAPVQRFSQRTPLQDGVTDLGYVLQPRVITLTLNFVAETDAILDGYRDDLHAIFKPSSGQATKLRITRDDGAVRQIETFATENEIGIVRVNRPGHLHQATIQLRAADPRWYSPTPGTVTLTAASTAWWLAGGAIGTAQVVEHVDTPAPDQAWAWSGTLSANYLIAMRLQPAYAPVNARYAFTSGSGVSLRANNSPSGSVQRVTFFQNGTLDVNTYGYISPGGWTFFPTIDSQYDNVFFRRYDWASWYTYLDYDSDGTVNPTHFGYYQNGTPVQALSHIASVPLIASGGYWGGNGGGTASQWPGTIERAAIYNDRLDIGQITALDMYMRLDATNEAALSYSGNAVEYPVITLAGPITSPIVYNATTGRKLDFTGATIAAGVTYTIDLRSDALNVTDSGGTLRTSQLMGDSDLGDWAIVPSPLATGGTNVITVAGTSIGTATAIRVVYYNRYVSY